MTLTQGNIAKVKVTVYIWQFFSRPLPFMGPLDGDDTSHNCCPWPRGCCCRGGGGICLVMTCLVPIGPKNTNLVEEVEILLPANYRCIPFSGFKAIENVSANRRPGRSSFFERPVKPNLGRERWDLAFCPVRWIPFSGLREDENGSATQRRGRPSC